MKEHKKRFRIEFTVNVRNEGFDREDWDWSDENIKSFALQELTCMSPFPEDITFSEVDSNWHTGTPTEEGDYLLVLNIANQRLDVANFKNGDFKSYHNYVIKPSYVKLWQKIEPYLERGENG